MFEKMFKEKTYYTFLNIKFKIKLLRKKSNPIPTNFPKNLFLRFLELLSKRDRDKINSLLREELNQRQFLWINSPEKFLKHFRPPKCFFIIKENDGEKSKRQLIQAASIDSYPHEVSQIHYFTKEGPSFSSPVWHGKIASLGENVSKEMIDHFRETLFEVKYIGLTLKRVEVTHVHPTLEFALLEEGSLTPFLWSLSKGAGNEDIRFMNYLKRWLPAERDSSAKPTLVLETLSPSYLYEQLLFS